MSDKEELLKLSKRELIRRYIELEERLEKVEKYLKSFDNPHTPSSKQQKTNTKNKEDKTNDKPRFPGKPEGSNGAGITLPEPDEVVEHKLDTCPISGLPLGKPIGYFKKTIIDFPDKPIQVIEHRIMQYISPTTGEIIEAKFISPLKKNFFLNCN